MKEPISNHSTFVTYSRQNKMPIRSDIRKKIIERIKIELKEKGFNYTSFAGLFGKTEGWFSHIMTGRTKLTIELLYEIADKLGVDPSSLLPGENPEQKPEFEEYIRNIVREEIEKASKKK